jgi:hypothetical protein
VLAGPDSVREFGLGQGPITIGSPWLANGIEQTAVHARAARTPPPRELRSAEAVLALPQPQLP